MSLQKLPHSINIGPYEPAVLVRFRPAWVYIDGIREFGRFFCAVTFDQPTLADRAQVMIQETLENAIKYSDRNCFSELEMAMTMDGKELVVSVCSTPSLEHLGALKNELDQLYQLDPEQAYLAAFERASRDPTASARLGLARLRFECKAELSVSEENGGRIRVTVRAVL